MGRTTSTQRGASRRSTPTAARSGSGGRGATTTRSRSAKAPARARTATKKSAARRPSGPWVPVLIVALVAVLGWSLYPALRLQYQASRRMAGLEQQYNSLRERNEALRSQVAELKTPKGVEKAARDNLGYAKNGERVYMVMPSTPASSAPARTASVAGAPDRTVVQVLLDALFGVEQPSSTVEP
jgi:cell division protein FtsB